MAKMTSAQRTKQEEADQLKVRRTVRAHVDALKAAQSHTELREFATTNGLDTASLFRKFKAALTRIGVDYDRLREEATAAAAAELAAAADAEGAPTLEAWAAGDAEVDSFAVCLHPDPTGPEDGVWYSTFHQDARRYRKGDQVSADTAAAESAVWLASKAREHAEHATVRLRLHITNHEVDASVLVAAGVKGRVVIDLDVSDANPAIEWARAPGFSRWTDIDLVDHLTP